MSNKKKTLKKSSAKSNITFVVVSLVVAIVLVIVIAGAAFMWISKYTEHGVEIEVPSVIGIYTEEAEVLLSAQDLHLQVIDSTYTDKVPFGAVVEQNPSAGAHVKHGRPIYVIVNAQSRRQVPMPDLHDMSYRQAMAMLQAVGLTLDSMRYEPSVYRDLVLDVEADGHTVEAGTRLEEGTAVVLIVGKGQGTEQTYVPNVVGKTISSAREILLGAHLVAGAINYDEQPTDTVQAVYVYEQSPNGGIWLLEGSRIDLMLTTDSLKATKKINNVDEEEFF